MIRFVPILALALAVSAPPPGGGTALAHTAQQRESGTSPRSLERRARNASPEQKAELLRQAAQRWLARGERRRAIRALDGAIQAQPEDPRLWLRRAELHAAGGANRAAIDDLDRAIELDSAQPAALRLRATLSRRIGARHRAAADLASAASGRRQAPRAARIERHPADATDEATLAALAPPRPLTPSTAPTGTQGGRRAIAPDALDALTISAMQASAPPRSLLPKAESLAAGGASDDAIAAQPARSALLEHPALDAVTMAAARVRAGGDPVPASAPVASNQPFFRPPERRGVVPSAPDPIEAHRRRMEAAAIVQRRIEAGEAMVAAMNAAPAGRLPDPSFRASTAPLPKIYRGTQIPAQLAAKAGIARGAAPSGGVGGPYLPVRRAAPASFDATPADPMIEHGVAAPVIAVKRGALR